MTDRRGLLRFGASILLSAGLVWWLLGDIGVGRVVATIRGAYLPGVLLGTAAFLAMVVARVIRYRVLLRARVGHGPLTLITLVRGMLADLLPARIGTLSYVYLVRTRAGVPLDDALSSFFLAFVLDVVAIAPLLLLALASVGFGISGAGVLAALAVLLLAGSVAGVFLLAPILRLAGRLVGAPGGGGSRPVWLDRAGETLESTAARVDEVRARGALLPAFGLSLLVRLTKFGAHWMFLQAVLVPLGVPWGEMSFLRSFLGVAGAELSAMLPISGLAAFGTWEAAWALGFTRLGLTQEQAILSGFATHVLSQVHDYGLGVLSLLLLMRPGAGGEDAPQADSGS